MWADMTMARGSYYPLRQIFYELNGADIYFSMLPPMSTAEDLLLERWLPALDTLVIENVTEHTSPSGDYHDGRRRCERNKAARLLTYVQKLLGYMRRRYSQTKGLIVGRKAWHR